jgi:hypothetical protein
MSQFHENLDRALDLSQRILNLARESEWGEMAKLDQERMPILKSLFNNLESQPFLADYQDRLEEILSLNEQALRVCREARSPMLKMGRQLKQGRTAVAAYLKQSHD